MDDNRTNRMILTEKLHQWELDATALATPEEVLATDVTGFDVLILDYKMPEMTGADLAIALKEKYGARTPPMILFSSVGQVESTLRAEIEAIGFAGMLTKPAKSGHLLEVLSKVVAGEAHKPQDALAPESESASLDLAILLVDDNRINRKVASKILQSHGLVPDAVASGAEAIELAKARPYDVILMDIEMPEMDGITATGLIRKALNPDTCPYIVALTANAMASERDTYLKSGMDDYLSKPIDVDALLSTLKVAKEFRAHQSEASAV